MTRKQKYKARLLTTFGRRPYLEEIEIVLHFDSVPYFILRDIWTDSNSV